MSVAYRFWLSSAIVGIYCLLKHRTLHLPRQVWLSVVLQGATIFSLNYILFYFAGKFIPSGINAVIFSSLSLWIMLNYFLFFKQKVSKQVLAGSLVGVSGIVMVFFAEAVQKPASLAVLFGVALSLLGTYFAAWGNIISKKLTAFNHPISLTNTYALLVGAVIASVVALLLGGEFTFDVSVRYIFALLYLSLFGTVLGFGGYFILLKKVGPERSAYVAILFPVVALVVSSLFEEFQWVLFDFIGIAAILVGNIIVFKGKASRV